mgnify:CR=1 FL=1
MTCAGTVVSGYGQGILDTVVGPTVVPISHGWVFRGIARVSVWQQRAV